MKTWKWVALGGLLLVFGGLLISTARQTSLVYDEVIYAPAGVLYWKTADFRWNPVHPPLQKLISALPLLNQDMYVPSQLNPIEENEWRMGYRLFFQSPTPAQQLIWRARWPTVAVSVLLALLIFLWGRRHFRHPAPAFFATALFVFDPLVLGNGSLAMNDMFVALFVFAATWAFDEMMTCPTWRNTLLVGFLAGAAIASKLSGLLLVPIYLFMLLRQKKKAWDVWPHALGVAGLALLVLAGSYGFHVAPLLHSLFAEWGMHTSEGTPGYLLGAVSGYVAWFYYPVAMLVKTPAPLLALWAASVFLLIKKPRDKVFLFSFMPILIFWTAALLSRNHFGVRYLLPTIPFVCLLVAEAYHKLEIKKEQWVFLGLGAWLVWSTLSAHPHHMAYFNSLIGGSKNGYKWLDGSNQDWGQDLPALAKLINAQVPRPALCLGYWGSNRPEAWGLEYQDVYSPAITNGFREDRPNPVNVEREWLVVSASLLTNPAIKGAYRWLKKKTPMAVVGHTLFVYDITEDTLSTHALQKIYESMGRFPLAQRQSERLTLIKSRQK